jgi:hypothetical protein
MNEKIAKLKGIPTKEELYKLLEEEVLEVTFIKLDGDKRVMTCTLKEDIKPKATKTDPLSQEKVRKVSDKVVSVWDVNAKGWRSFRYERVEKVEKVLTLDEKSVQ